MLIHNEFPRNRQRDPKRRAEWRTYRSLEETDRDGHVLYEVKVGQHAPEVDFFVIIQDKAVVCIQVKGGRYRIVSGDWHPETDDGLELVRDPMKLTWDSAMAVRDYLKEKIGRKVFMLSVLLLPDMEWDKDIELMADDKTAVMFGVEDLVERLVDLAEERDVYGTPSPHIAERIVHTLMPQLKVGLPDEDDAASSELSLADRPVEVHHADVVNVYNGPVTINNNYGSENGDSAPKGVTPC